MKNKITKFLKALFIVFGLTACNIFEINKVTTEHYIIKYTDEKIDTKSLDTYFLDNEEIYPSYKALKKNNPNLLNNVKMIDSTGHFSDNIKMFRFSNVSNNGFLEGETFLYHSGNYYQLGVAWGGYGVTEFIRRQDNGEHWLYFIYSSGSGIHRTGIGIYNFSGDFYYLEGLELETNIDYTFMLDESENTIDLYKASIDVAHHSDGFDTYSITEGDLAFESINDMKKIKIEFNQDDNSSSGIYYGTEHTPILKDHKDPTCLEDGYDIIGCASCDEIYEKTILPKVDCYYENGYCKWCGTQELEHIIEDPFYDLSVPQDIEYNERHYRMLQGNNIKTEITKDEVGDLLGYIIREEDISSFTSEYPNTDYIISKGVYDYYNNNRIPFYSVKEFEDLSYICVRILGTYTLYQDITNLLDK